jgi:hypothetical protein
MTEESMRYPFSFHMEQRADRKRALDIGRLFSEPEFQPLHAYARVRNVMARVGLPR